METTRRGQPSDVSSLLDRLKEKRKKCLTANAADRAEEVARQRLRSLAYKNQSKEEEDSEKIKDSDEDRINWTSRQWEEYEKSKSRGVKQGYKGHFDLAHATYLKEMSRKKIDKEKYKRAMESGQLLLNVSLDRADVDELANSLAEASERRLKKRKTQESGGDFITEKNRQFNMKLDREYGKE